MKHFVQGSEHELSHGFFRQRPVDGDAQIFHGHGPFPDHFQPVGVPGGNELLDLEVHFTPQGQLSFLFEMVRDLEPEVVISFQNGHVVSQEKRVHSPQLLEPLLEHDLVNPLFFFGEKVFQRVGALTEKRPPGLDHTIGEQGVSFNTFKAVYQGF